MSERWLLGAVLAGGESRRYGRDKAVAIVAGRPLVARAAETLAEVFETVVVVSPRETHATRWMQLPDLRPGQGPLAGIEAALTHAEAQGLDGAFVLACDLPLVDANAVRAIVAADTAGSVVAPARVGDSGIEPLCAVYDVSCLPVVRAALDGGSRAAYRVFEAMHGTVVHLERDIFLNVNRPADAERAELALERCDP